MKPIPITDTSNLTFSAGHHRKYDRYETVVKYQLLLNGAEHQGIVENISLGGACLATSAPKITEQDLFSEGELALFVDEELVVRVRCKIMSVWSWQEDMMTVVGIEFINPDLLSIVEIIDHDI